MPIYQVVILALIQALTEFLPVSSSGHLEIAPRLFHWHDPGLIFDIALHTGTLVSILLYFFKDWLQLLGRGFGLKIGTDPELNKNPMMLWMIALATIPLGLAGLAFGKQAEGAWRSPYLIGTMLVVIGIFMWYAERAASHGNKDLGTMSWADGIVIGVSQALAVVPGTSRSGVTITTGLLRGLTRESAARFSFLLSAPAILAASLKGAHDIQKNGGIPTDMQLPFALGTLISGLGGVVVIAYFLKYLKRNSLMPFVYYRIIFGIIVVALAFFRVLAE
jgi:undecaprenyl-diphosphatase